MAERLSLTDDTLISSYVEHIERYKFALPYCSGKRVLDAGCGIGYGSSYLASNGAASVMAIDISESALAEARRIFRKSNLGFRQADVEAIDQRLGDFDVIVNFENLEHLQHPERLVGAAALMVPRGTFLTSTPNGALKNVDATGKPTNPFHVKEFTADELMSLLSPKFKKVSLYGQWLTYNGQLRKQRARQLFTQLSENYNNPAATLGRIIKRAFGKRGAEPPLYHGDADSFEGDYAIKPISDDEFPWEATTLIAVCQDA